MQNVNVIMFYSQDKKENNKSTSYTLSLTKSVSAQKLLPRLHQRLLVYTTNFSEGPAIWIYVYADMQILSQPKIPVFWIVDIVVVSVEI